MSWFGKLRGWVSGKAFGKSGLEIPMSLEARIGTAEHELGQITRDVYAVLLDTRGRSARHS